MKCNHHPVVADQLFTANDNPRRDPVSWTVEWRAPGAAEWELLSDVRSFSPTLDRKSGYGRHRHHALLACLSRHTRHLHVSRARQPPSRAERSPPRQAAADPPDGKWQRGTGERGGECGGGGEHGDGRVERRADV